MPPASNVALHEGNESFFIVDPKDLRTKTIERLVAPFVALVSGVLRNKSNFLT